jgi:hypothetical protein
MKKLVNIVSPYLLLLIPVFVGLVILLVNPDDEALGRSVELHAAFFKVPHINLFEVVISFFKCPSL